MAWRRWASSPSRRTSASQSKNFEPAKLLCRTEATACVSRRNWLRYRGLARSADRVDSFADLPRAGVGFTNANRSGCARFPCRACARVGFRHHARWDREDSGPNTDFGSSEQTERLVACHKWLGYRCCRDRRLLDVAPVASDAANKFKHCVRCSRHHCARAPGDSSEKHRRASV